MIRLPPNVATSASESIRRSNRLAGARRYSNHGQVGLVPPASIRPTDIRRDLAVVELGQLAVQFGAQRWQRGDPRIGPRLVGVARAGNDRADRVEIEAPA